MSRPILSPAARRQRRLRERRKYNLLVARADVPAILAEALIEADLLPESVSDNPRALGKALVSAARQLVSGGR